MPAWVEVARELLISFIGGNLPLPIVAVLVVALFAWMVNKRYVWSWVHERRRRKMTVVTIYVLWFVVGGVVTVSVAFFSQKQFEAKQTPSGSLDLVIGPFRFDEFRPTLDVLWVFHQFTVKVHHSQPNALADLRAEITTLEPHLPSAPTLPLALRVREIGIQEAVVDVFRVNHNWLDSGPIQLCGKSLLLSPPDQVAPGVYSAMQTGMIERRGYRLTITALAGGVVARRTFLIEPSKPTYGFSLITTP